MKFDQDQPDRPVNLTRRTTKVNLTVVIGVVLFLIAGFVAVLYFASHWPQTTEEAQDADVLPGQ